VNGVVINTYCISALVISELVIGILLLVLFPTQLETFVYVLFHPP
jgi:hypothetical protein